MAKATESLSILNHPPMRLPGSGLLHDLVQHGSHQRPPAIHAMLSTGEETIVPYRSLHRAAEKLASRIRDAAGNQSDQGTFVVPLLIPQCPRLYIAILAVLKAGGAFCPLHLDAPPERIQFIVEDVGAKVLLATPGLVDKLPSGEENFTVLQLPDAMDFADSPCFDHQDGFIAPLISSDQLAYVMYTSGSTGTPKGVGISHDAATQSIRAHDRHIPPFQRFLQFASPTFDVSVFEIIFPLFRGCTLVTCDRRRMLDDLPGVINSMRVDACELTPTVAASLLQKRTSVPCLKLLLTIGEMLSEGVVQEFGGSPTVPSILWGMYGPTEAAIHCTLQCNFGKSSSPRSIGLPLDTVSCFVIQIPEGDGGPKFQILPAGEVGELAIGGHQLATEYLNRPQQNAESFIETTYGRLYRTGDKAKVNADGTLECFGRVADGQVKLRGQRIELGELEQAAMRGSKCRAVVASVVETTLVAFCLSKEGLSHADAAQDVFDACRAWLPSFMVPGDVLAMTEFPRLPSGKVDRKQLSQIYAKSKQERNHDPNTPASNTLEAKVTALASSLLESPVATTSTLSASGLDSLKAIELASALRANGIESSALQILGSRTVSSLCEAIRLTRPANSSQDRSSILDKELVLSLDSPRQSEIESVYMCTPLQMSMLAETSLHPSAYFNTVELEFPTQCEPDQIKRCFHRLARDNDILRSYFTSHTRGFLRVVLRHLPDNHVLISEPRDDLTGPNDGAEVPAFKVHIYRGDDRRPPRALLRLHHAAYDGWSVDLMTRDLSTLVDGGSPPTRPQFDKVSSFYSGLLPQQLDDSRAWWADHLRNWRPTSFPSFLSKTSKESQPQRATRKFGMNQGQLEQASIALGCHPQVLFQATVSLLWSMLLGTSDVVIGSVSSGRTIPVDGIEGIMGPCIFPVPMRINLDTAQSVAELLRSIQATNRDILKHGMLPLSEIKKVSEIQPGDPVYDVLLVYQQSLYSSSKATSSVREVDHFDSLETKVLLEIEPIDASEMWCHVTHHANAINLPQAEILLEQLDHLACHLVSHVEALVSDMYRCFPPSLSSMYNIEPSTSADCCDLATSFERMALSRPGAIAVSFADSISAELRLQTVSYSNLNETSNRIAWYLRSLGLGNGQIAVVIMDKSVMLYATILAILKAGCAYLPLLPSTPLERIDIAMRQSKAALCLTDDRLLPRLQGSWVPCIATSVRSIDLSKFPAHNLSRQEEGSRPAYVICTSGTTGTPKSIVITHLNITSNLDMLSNIYPFDVDSRLLQLCSQSFDVSVFEIFFTWKKGACLCSGSHDTLFEDLENSIRSMRCTHLSMTPTVAALVNPENVPSVRFLVTAGEPMTANVARTWGSLLYQGYGPAETTNICSVKQMSEKDDISHLGFSLPNTSAFVFSTKSTDLVPLNCLGELCFGGDQVAQGYLGMPEANASNFIHHPRFGRLYRSGDLGRMLPDGSMIIAGRLDGQVKIRGQRVETREVDSTLGNAKNVHSSTCLICRRDSTGADRLVAFYVPRGQNEDDFRLLPIDQSQSSINMELFDLLQSRLPAYMLPTFLVPISTIPLTTNGKVDKTLLQHAFAKAQQDYLDSAVAGPRDLSDRDWSETERQVAQCIADALDAPVDTITRWQPLAAVGLDSITAVSVSKKLSSQFKHRLAISSVLKNQSVAKLSQLILALPTEEAVDPPASLNKVFLEEDFLRRTTVAFASEGKDVETILPSTPLQEAMLSSMDSESYLNRLVFRLRIPQRAAKEYWRRLAHRHGILRTCFATTTDRRHSTAQVVLRSWPLPWIDDQGDQLTQRDTNSRQKVPKALDSRTPPYVLETFHRDGDTFLSFSCHHALFDGESIHVLLRELELMHQQQMLPRTISYELILQSMFALPESTEVFWTQVFEGFRPRRRELSSAGNEKTAADAKISSQAVSSTLRVSLSRIRKATSEAGVSLLTFCQAAWVVVLTQIFAESDVCFGNVMSGRTLPIDGIDTLAAPCFNTVPIRLEISQEADVSKLLKRLQKLNSELLDYQFTPLRLIQKLVAPASGHLFDNILLLQPPRKQLNPDIWELFEDTGAMDVPLACELIPDSEMDTIETNLYSNSSDVDEHKLSAISASIAWAFDTLVNIPASRLLTGLHMPEQLRQSVSMNGLDSLSRLPAVDIASPSYADLRSDSSDESWTAHEEVIRQSLAKLSGVSEDRIQRQTTIFELGLDSISAVQIAALLREHGLRASAVDVIQSPSCADLARELTRSAESKLQRLQQQRYGIRQFQREVGSRFKQRLVFPDAFDRLLPCTPVQCGMLSDFLQSKGQHYVNFLSFKFNPDVNLEDVELAWQAMFRHSSMLRTGFVQVDHPDSAFAMVQYSADIPCPVKTLVRPGSQGSDFDVQRWRSNCSNAILQNLQSPAWGVAIDKSNSGVTMHLAMLHALYDAESMHRMMHGLAELLKGQTLSPEEPVDLAISSILGAALDKSESSSFWQQKAPQPVINSFPTMTPLIDTSTSLLVESRTMQKRFSDFQDDARKIGVSIQSLLQAAWTKILAAYLGEPSVVFGVVLSGRTMTETKKALCPTFVTLPVIANSQVSNDELLRQMMAYNAELLAHQYCPLPWIQKWLGYPATQIFDTLLVYQRLSFALPSDELPWHKIHEEAKLQYPLSLEVEPLPGDVVEMRISYRANVIPEKQASLMLRQFEATLNELSSPGKPGKPVIGDDLLSISPPLEPEIFADEDLLHHFVETASQNYPNRVAVEFVTAFHGEVSECQTWNFYELNQMGDRVANVLRERASGPGLVAVHFDKCPEAFFSMLGILKAGFGFLALDCSAPPARKEFILKDSGAIALLTERTTLDFQASQPVIQITMPLLSEVSPKPNQMPYVRKSDTCYCLYTSGTTGTPKGCEISHENAVQAMKAFQRLFDGHWDDSSRWLQFASLHFDVSVLEQYWTWSVGMTMVAAPRDLILDDLAATIRRLRITHIDLTPSLARLLDPEDVPSLCKGVFITGGEALKQEILETWGPSGVIYNAYGPTEATIGVTMYQRVPANGRPSNIGRQFDNVGTMVLQPGTENPVMRGAVGELCIFGKLVGKGYLNRHELTQERFPTLKDLGTRVYRTGDLVRQLHDGCFDFLGRIDDQVKLRGQRLEIGEINHAILSTVPNIKDVATLVAQHPTAGKDLLVSFVVPESSAQTSSEPETLAISATQQLRIAAQSACRNKLPGYMVPTYVFEVPFMPLSANNKADGKTLGRLFRNLAPQELLHSSSSDQIRPSSVTPTQRSIMMSVEEFGNFPQDAISVSTNLFDLGIDSISSLRLSRILKRAGHSVADPAMILRNPVLSDLADAIGKAGRSHGLGSIQEAQQIVQAFNHRFRFQVLREAHIDPSADIEYVAPCTPLQQGMLSNALAREGKTYFAAFHLNLAKGTSIHRLKGAWSQLVAQHSIFRTTFCRTTEGFAQIALKSGHLPWHETSVSENDFEKTLKTARDSWIAENRDTLKRPLELLLIESPSRRVLVVHIFHAIYDGTSLEFMLQWVAEEYTGKRHLETPSFIEAMCLGPMRDFDFSRPFWVHHLENCDFSLIGGPLDSSATCYISSCRDISLDGLEKARKLDGVTLQTLVLALWSLCFGNCVSQKAAFGVVVSGRALDLDRPECILGPLFNTLPFYPDLKREAWQSTLSRCHDFNTASLEYQHCPLRKIQQWCSGGRPIFDSLFVFQANTPPLHETDRLWHLHDDASFLDYPLAFEASATPEHRLRVRLVASVDVFTEAKLLEILDEFEEMAACVSQGGETGLGRKFSGPVTNFDGINGIRPKFVEARSNEPKPLEISVPDFEWSDTALTIRKEISSLAQVPLDQVSSEVRLLELGLDSIDAVSISTRLRDVGISLSMPQILRAQSIRGICSAIVQTQLRSNQGDEATTVGGASFQFLRSRLEQHVKSTGLDMGLVESILPATPTQASMMADMIDSDFTHYFNHDVLELSSGIDLSRLAEAWVALLERSPVLRTVFHQIEDPGIDYTFVQVVLKTLGPLEAPSRLKSTDDLDTIIHRNHREAASQKGHANLCRVTFAQVEDKSFLVLSLAHSLYDGWSLSLLFQDLASLYNGHGVERPSYELAIQNSVNSTRDHATQNFWSQYLADASPSILQERPKQRGQLTHRTERASLTSIDRVAEFCRLNSVSLQALGSACWSAVLASWLGTLDVTFGVVLSGRDTAESQQLAFPMMSTVAVRSVLHGSFQSFLAYLQGTLIEVHQYRALPLRQALSVAEAPKPLFNTLFLLQRHPDSGHTADGQEPFFQSKSVSAATEFAICVELEDTGECLTWRIAGEDAFVSAQMVVELCDQLERVLQNFVHDVEAKMLQFEGEHVSICGLQAFRITEQKSQPPQVSVEPSASSDRPITWSETALLIRRALSEVAGLPEGSVLQQHTPYHIGLDSVSVIKVSSLLRKRGLEVGPRTLLTASSITEMADLIDQNQPGFGSLTAFEIREKQLSKVVDIHQTLHAACVQPAHVQDTLPALPLQEYMITAWQNSAGQLFWPTFKYRLASHVSFALLESSWRALVASEPILRTCIIATTERSLPFLQVILQPNVGGPHEAAIMETSDVTQLEDRDDASCAWPQVRLTANKQHDSSWVLRLKIHHALYDGVSLPQLISRLDMALRGAILDRPEQYFSHWKNFAYFHQDEQSTSSRQAFWTEYLKDSSDTLLSQDDEVQVQRTVYFERAAIADVGKLRATSTSRGVGIPAIFLAAVAQIICQKVKFEHDDILLGVYCAQTGQVMELGETFPKLNILPLHVRMTQNADLIEVALQIQKDLHSITSPINSTASLSEIRDWTGIRTDVCVNFLNAEVGRYENGTFSGDRYIEAMTDYTVEINGEWASSRETHAPWLQPNTVRDIANNTLDIEASIENQSLNIGLFGSAHGVAKDGAKEFVSHLAESLDMA